MATDMEVIIVCRLDNNKNVETYNITYLIISSVNIRPHLRIFLAQRRISRHAYDVLALLMSSLNVAFTFVSLG